MTKTYNEVEFDIDLISSSYNTTNPHMIQIKAKEDLDSDISILDIVSYLNIEETVNKYSVKMKEIF